MKSKQLTGFTLAELLVSISIIGLLASIIFSVVSPSKVQARDTQRKSDVQQFSKALVMYHDETGSMPPNVGSTYEEKFQNAGQILVDSGYLPMVPKDPGSGNYLYHNYGQGSGNGAMVRAVMEKTPSGGAGGFSGNCGPITSGEAPTIGPITSFKILSNNQADGLLFQELIVWGGNYGGRILVTGVDGDGKITSAFITNPGSGYTSNTDYALYANYYMYTGIIGKILVNPDPSSSWCQRGGDYCVCLPY